MNTQQPVFPIITQPSSTPRTFAALVDHMPKDCTEWSEVYLELSVVTCQLETELATSNARVKEAEAECLEQARLLGMSGSREAELLGKLERMERDLAAKTFRKSSY